MRTGESVSHTLAHGPVKDYSSGDRDPSFQDTGGRLDPCTFPLLAGDNTGFLVETLLIPSLYILSPPPLTQRALRMWIWEKFRLYRGK